MHAAACLQVSGSGDVPDVAVIDPVVLLEPASPDVWLHAMGDSEALYSLQDPHCFKPGAWYLTEDGKLKLYSFERDDDYSLTRRGLSALAAVRGSF